MLSTELYQRQLPGLSARAHQSGKQGVGAIVQIPGVNGNKLEPYCATNTAFSRASAVSGCE